MLLRVTPAVTRGASNEPQPLESTRMVNVAPCGPRSNVRRHGYGVGA